MKKMNASATNHLEHRDPQIISASRLGAHGLAWERPVQVSHQLWVVLTGQNLLHGTRASHLKPLHHHQQGPAFQTWRVIMISCNSFLTRFSFPYLVTRAAVGTGAFLSSKWRKLKRSCPSIAKTVPGFQQNSITAGPVTHFSFPYVGMELLLCCSK